MPYFVVPWRRGRWCTGTSESRAPANRSRVGRKRCMPSKSGMRAARAVGITRSVQPTSAIDSPVSRLRTALATRDDTRRTHVSRRSTRTPHTTS